MHVGEAFASPTHVVVRKVFQRSRARYHQPIEERMHLIVTL